MNVSGSCVGPDGHFIVGVHTPDFGVKNLRANSYIQPLGQLKDGTVIENQANFPDNDLYEPGADTIYEIANAFDFRGTTYINSAWADAKAAHPETIKIAEPSPCSLIKNFKTFSDKAALIDLLPHPILLALAQASTDPKELELLAQKSCAVLLDPKNHRPTGIGYKKDKAGRIIPDIYDHTLFEVLVNNPYLPDDYKNALVLKPGVQGSNEITGEYIGADKKTHVFEYLRRNSYIPWGHFASNMANDAIRYSAKSLSFEDMTGIRHLYYQRAYVRLAQTLNIPCPEKQESLTPDALEDLRKQIMDCIRSSAGPSPDFNATLWGWNFGYGYAQSGHRLHASHQMIHQQNALVPETVSTPSGNKIPSFACGDMVDAFIARYKQATGNDFFKTYIHAVQNNTRTDGNTTGPSSLIVAEDEYTLLFAPKAQISEWELQIMTKTACGNIFDADTKIRASLDRNILLAVKILEALGAKMVTGIEYSKRLDKIENNQHLLYSFIPRLPYAPGTFSEAQLRWISGVYPEDFVYACKAALPDLQ